MLCYSQCSLVHWGQEEQCLGPIMLLGIHKIFYFSYVFISLKVKIKNEYYPAWIIFIFIKHNFKYFFNGRRS